MGQGTSKEFKIGDKVRIIRDLSAVRELQKGHGGWNDDMEMCLGKVGTVKLIHPSRDTVIYVSGRMWVFNPLCLTPAPGEVPDGGEDIDLLRLLLAAAAAAVSYGSEKSTVTTYRKFNPGDTICVLDDVKIVRRLQEGHGGWVEPMSKSIGQTGKVLSVDRDGDVKIEVSGGSWTYNPLCLIPANKQKFNPGDMVRVLDDAEVVQHLQNGHGEWVDGMLTSIGQTGNVLFVDEDGGVKVAVGGGTWTFNPLCLAPANKDSSQKFNPGDMVCVLDDADEVRRLQEGHGEWVDEMAKSIGQTGKVLRVDKDGDVAVVFRSSMWAFNPLCLRPVNKDSTSKEITPVVAQWHTLETPGFYLRLIKNQVRRILSLSWIKPPYLSMVIDKLFRNYEKGTENSVPELFHQGLLHAWTRNRPKFV